MLLSKTLCRNLFPDLKISTIYRPLSIRASSLFISVVKSSSLYPLSYLLWPDSHVPSTFICWNPPLQSDSIRKGGLWEVLSSRGSIPHKWSQSSYKRYCRDSCVLPPYEGAAGRQHPWTRKRALTRHGASGSLLLGFPASRVVRQEFLLHIYHCLMIFRCNSSNELKHCIMVCFIFTYSLTLIILLWVRLKTYDCIYIIFCSCLDSL